MERLQEQFNKEIGPALAKEFGFTNVMEVPRIEKIVINVGIGKQGREKKFVEAAIADLKKITGQMPVLTLARKSIAGFKMREKQEVGLVVTLRGFRMYSFLDKLINVALPRVRDFRGVKANGFDGRGNYHLGLKEHLVFPEISNEALEHSFGMQVSIVINSSQDEVSRKLLQYFHFPFNLE